MRLDPGKKIPARTLETVDGEQVSVPHADWLTHLQFRRFAGCPLCNLHLRSFQLRHDEITAKGIREVVLFHSTAATLRPYTAELPFAVVADPDKRQYVEFGVESAPRSLLDPRVWPRIVQAIGRDVIAHLRGKQPLPPFVPEGGRLGLSADFLLDGDGRVVACHYGAHAYDQWSVDELLALVPAEVTRRRS